MKEKNLDNYSEVQMLFTNRVASLIHSKGRTMIGWNDIMGKNIHEWADSDNESAHALAPYAIVQFWKGDTALIAEALKQGHRVINSSHRDTYLDYNHTKFLWKKPTISLLFQKAWTENTNRCCWDRAVKCGANGYLASKTCNAKCFPA